MSKTLRVLFLQDKEESVELLAQHIRKGGWDVYHRRIDQADGLSEALTDEWDVVIADYDFCRMTEIDALNISNSSNPKLPFIFVSDSADEEAMVQALKSGACNFITNNNLSRLEPAIDRELSGVKIRGDRSGVNKLAHLNRILESIRRVNRLILTARDEHTLIQKGCEILVESQGLDTAWVALLGKENNVDDYASAGVADACVHHISKWSSDNLPPCAQAIINRKAGFIYPHEEGFCDKCAISENGKSLGKVSLGLKYHNRLFGIMTMLVPERRWIDEHELSLIRDIGDDLAYALYNLEQRRMHLKAMNELSQSEERFRLLFKHAPVGIARLSTDFRYLDVNPAFCKLLGYEKHELTGIRISDVTHPDDITESLEQQERLVRREIDSFSLEKRFVHRDGSLVDALVVASSVGSDNGKPRYLIELIVDISERKKYEQQLQKWGHVFRHADWGIATSADPEGMELGSFNPAFARMLGYNEEELRHMKTDRLFPSELLVGIETIWNKLQRDGWGTFETRMHRKDGSDFPVIINASAVKDREGNVEYYVGNIQDITVQKHSEIALRESEESLKMVQRIAHLGSCKTDIQSGMSQWSDEFYRICGYEPGEITSSVDSFIQLIHPDDRERAARSIERMIAEKGDYEIEQRIVRPDGEVRHVFSQGQVQCDAEGNPRTIVGAMLDITHRKVAENALLEQTHHLEERVKEINCLYNVTRLLSNPDTDLTNALQEVVQIIPMAWQFPEITCARIELGDLDWRSLNYVESEWKLRSPVKLSGGNIGLLEICYREERPEDFEGPFLKEERVLVDVISAIIERFIDLHRSQLALKESEEKFRKLIEQSNIGIYLRKGRKFELINSSFTEIFGYTIEETNADDFDFINLVSPKSLHIIQQRKEMLEEGLEPEPRYDFVAVTKDGRELDVETSVSYSEIDGEMASLGIIRDVTERKKLEAKVQQTSKLEAIGSLAGGIAHDFNNLLTVIIGHVDLLMQHLDANDPHNKGVKQIKQAAESAAKLTRQLLAFGRKQALKPEIHNLNAVLNKMQDMLDRMIGEEVVLRISLTEGLWNIKADAGQMEQIIINLAVNARDAMPKGGELKIETSNERVEKDYYSKHDEFTAGEYVAMTVSDRGCGMTDDVLAQMFDPFFTTKERGQGTGLGLATVYGIIKQSGGSVEVESEVGRGTVFKFYFPRAGDFDPVVEKHIDRKEKFSGSETLLLVEDDDNVRQTTHAILTHYGYNVISASSGMEALSMCEELDRPVDLVVTDVIMPNMNGLRLAEHLVKLWDGIKVLFVSGYTDDIILSGELTGMNLSYLQKPFQPVDLARKVRGMLDE